MSKQKNIKIAIYSGEIPSTTFIERLTKGLLEKGHEIFLFGLQNSSPDYSGNVHVIGYKNYRVSKALILLKYSILLLLFRRKEKQALDTFLKQQSRDTLYSKVKYYPVLWYKPDVFHLQWAKGIKEWFWVKDFGIKLILSLRGAHINYSPIANKELAKTYNAFFPKVDGFHAVSKAIAKEAQLYGADKDKIDVVYSGLDIPSTLKAVKATSSKVKLLSVGRSHWKKGYQYALDACKLLKDKNIPFSYTIIGLDNNIELLYHIKDLGLQEHIKIIDRLPFLEVQEAIREADVLVLPSVEEGIANVVLEAMINSTVVISTDCGGMPEVISADNGFLVAKRNPKAIADAVIKILELNPEALEEIKAKAITTIRKQHNKASMVDGMLNLYRKVLELR